MPWGTRRDGSGPENGQMNFHVSKEREVLFINGKSKLCNLEKRLRQIEKHSLRIWSQYALLWPKIPTRCQALSKQLLEKEHIVLPLCQFKAHLHQKERVYHCLPQGKKDMKTLGKAEEREHLEVSRCGESVRGQT